MKPKYEEKIEIIPCLNGRLLCSLSWRGHKWTEELPSNIHTFTEAEFKAHLARFVIPKLRVNLLKAQKEELEKLDESAEIPQDCVTSIEYSEQDLTRMVKAGAKRERKAAKLKVLN